MVHSNKCSASSWAYRRWAANQHAERLAVIMEDHIGERQNLAGNYQTLGVALVYVMSIGFPVEDNARWIK